jgi:hypothetical protein
MDDRIEEKERGRVSEGLLLLTKPRVEMTTNMYIYNNTITALFLTTMILFRMFLREDHFKNCKNKLQD